MTRMTKQRWLYLTTAVLVLPAGCGSLKQGEDTTGSAPPSNCVGRKKEVAFPPDITETFQSAVSTSSNGTVTFWVKAVDPQGCAMSFSWASNVGTSTPTTTADASEVVWTAPACAPSGTTATLTATVTNALGLSATTAFTVSGLTACATSSAQTLAAGGGHTVMLNQDGTVWTWGLNSVGQLGDGTTTQRTSPVQVPGLFNVSAIVAGDYHTLALKQDGTLWAWGSNGYGQLGDGTTTHYRTSPVQVPGLSNASAITAGHCHTVALKQDGTLWAWGCNDFGQLGDGTTTTTGRTSPVQVPGLSNVIATAAGYYHTVALKQDGTVWAWGYNGGGQLGDGTTTHRASPVQVPGLSNASAITAGSSHTVALKQDGTLWAWGSNGFGQLGDGTTTTYRTSPVQVLGLYNASAITTGYYHTLALEQDGPVWAWGENANGRLGDGTTTHRASPVQVPGLCNVSAIAAGGNHSLALKQDGTLWAWGSNVYGQLGDGTTTYQRASPVQVLGLSNVSATADSNSPPCAEAGRDAMSLGEEKPTMSTRSRGREAALAP